MSEYNGQCQERTNSVSSKLKALGLVIVAAACLPLALCTETRFRILCRQPAAFSEALL